MATLALFLGGLIVLALFVFVERRAADPVVPLDLFAERIIAVSAFGNVAMGGVLLGVSVYVPLFVQGALGGTALTAGAAVASLSIGWPVGSFVGGRMLLLTGYRATLLLGSALIALGSALCVPMDGGTSLAYVVVAVVVIGLGLGFSSTSYLVSVQNAVPWRRRGVATSSVVFFRTVGGSLGVAVMGAFLNASLGERYRAAVDRAAGETPASDACSPTRTPCCSPPCAAASPRRPTRSSPAPSPPPSARRSGCCSSSASRPSPWRRSSHAARPRISPTGRRTMDETTRELTLDDLPRPPLFKLVDPEGNDVFQETEVGGETARVGALFSDRELAGEFSAGAAAHGMEDLSGLDPRELPDWASVEAFALSGADYLLVVSEGGAGLFHAEDVAQKAQESAGEIPFPLYLISDEGGEAPLISVEVDEGEVLVAALFSSPENARDFRETAAHLDLPDSLGTIEDSDGLRRHALDSARSRGDLRRRRPRIRAHGGDTR